MDQKTVINRLGRSGCVVAAMAIGLPAFGQTAYFSFQGVFLNAGDQHDFNFNLSRTVNNTEIVRFTTYASSGGVNAAGSTIGSGGIDSVLDLTDSTLFQHGFNDDASGLDSQITWTQATGVALNPNPLPVESYRLNMIEFGNNAAGAWAVDLVAPADAITLTGSTPNGTSTVSSLRFGTLTSTGAAATFNQVATLNITGPMVVAQDGKAVFNNTGATTVGGQIDVKSGGILNANAGTFNANGNINLNGGTLNANLANFTLASGKTLAASNNAQVNTSGNFFLNGGKIVHLSGGADMTHTSQLSVGAASAGTLTVTGTGSTMTQNGSLLISQQGGAGSLSVTNNASMDVNGFLTVSGFLAGAGTDGTLDVLTGGDVTADTIRIGHNDGDQGTGVLTVDGAGSTVVQSGASTLTVGNTDTPGNNGSHAIIVQNGGAFTTGTGATTVNKTGEIGVYGGTFTANGATNLNNGILEVTGTGVFNAQGPVNVDGANGLTSFTTGNSFNLTTGQMFTASNSAIAYIGSSYELDDATTFTFNSGAGFFLESYLDVGNGTNGTLIVDGAGSHLLTNQLSSTSLDWGQDGAAAAVTVRNQGIATIGNGAALRLARTGAASTSGTLNVESGGTFNANSIELATGSATSGTITVTGTGSMLTQSGASTLTVGSSGTGAATLNVADAGVFTTGTGTTTINATGTLNLPDDGIFNANGNVNIDGGTINAAFFNTFRLAAGKTMTLSNNAQYNGGNYGVDDGTTLNVLSGSDLILPLGLDVGFGSNGTLVVDGTGSSVTSGISFTSIIGAGGVTGNATFRNNAAGDFQQILELAWGTDANTTGNLNVLTGADITTLDIKIAEDGTSGGSGTLTVNGSGSTLTQSGASTLTLGHATDGTATVDVQNAGVFTTGTGATTINATGTLSINTNGGFNAKGDLNLNAGGTLNINSGGQLNLDGTTLNINASANFDAAGGTVFLNNNGVFNGAAITSQAFGTLRVENGATANLGAFVSVDILIQDDGILNLPATTTSQFVVNDVQDFNSATFNGTLFLGETTAGPSAASMILGTNDVLTVKGLTSVGLSKAASLSVNDGTFHADGGLLLGYTTFGGAGSPGTVTVNAGTLNASNAAGLPIALGVGGIISLGNSPGNALILNDGELNVNGLLYVAPGNSFTMADGELDAGALVNEGTVNITGGHVKLNTWVSGSLASPTFGVVDIAAASLTIGTTRTGSFFPLLPIISIGTGESLTAASVDVGVDVNAELLISGGGVVTTTTLSSDIGRGGSTGTVTISGTGSVWNVGGGGMDIERGTVTVFGGGAIVTTGASGSVDIFEHGVLRGNGSITVNDELYNEGTLILDSVTDASVIADLEIFGNYTQDTDGTIEVGTVSGSENFLEQLRVHDGLITLAGELAFDPTADYSTLLQYNTNIGPIILGVDTATRVGVFNTVTGGDLGDGTGLAIIYGSARVDIMRAIAGDLNFDGFVGIADLNIVLGNWNQNVTAGVWGQGDPSGDGFIGIADLNVVLGNWNTGTPPPAAGNAVPEPGAGVMLLVSGLFAARGCRRGGRGGMI